MQVAKNSLFTLHLEDVTKIFGEMILFQDLSFDFQSATFYALTGKNGSGKSTLLRILTFLEAVSFGKLLFLEEGIPSTLTRYRQDIAYMAPLTAVYHKLTALENLNFFLTLRHKSLAKRELVGILSRVGLASNEEFFSARIVEDFSTGERERLKLALLLALDARIWLLDEPFLHLDEEGKAFFYEILQGAKKEGKLIILATNEKKEASFADEIFSLDV